MSESYVGEIRLFPFRKVPSGWAVCDGSLLPINANQALYSLIGTSFGGDGKANFALPNLQGRTIVGASGTSGVPPQVGGTGGTETVALTVAQMPAHAHPVMGAPSNGTTASAAGAFMATPVAPASLANPPPPPSLYGTGGSSLQALNAGAVGPAGGGTPHENRQPYLALVHCICTQGIYPSRP